MIGFAILAVLFLATSLGKKRGPSTSSKVRTEAATKVFALVDGTEQRYRAAHGRYTGNLADLVSMNPALAPSPPLVDVKLDASIDGKTYLVRVTSNAMSLTRARTAGRQIEFGCEFIGSHRGLTCPTS